MSMIFLALSLATPPESTVVHVSVRSFAPPADDDDGLLKKEESFDCPVLSLFGLDVSAALESSARERLLDG